MTKPPRVTVVGGPDSGGVAPPPDAPATAPGLRASPAAPLAVPQEEVESVAPATRPDAAAPSPPSAVLTLTERTPGAAGPAYVALRTFHFRFGGGPALTQIRQGQVLSRPSEVQELLAAMSPIAPAGDTRVVLCPHCGGEVVTATPLPPAGTPRAAEPLI